MNPDPAAGHFYQWGNVILWIVLGGVFLLFTPFYHKSQRKPASVYLAFMVAMAFEMFGIPMSIYILTWLLGTTLPEGILWGHTLIEQFGQTPMYIGWALTGAGILLVVVGWAAVHRRYWSKEAGRGELITNGIYGYIRHPQYTGFMLITLGMLLDWATPPMILMYPILCWLYYRLARREEADMAQEFGPAYAAYQQRTGMFLPRLLPAPRTRAPSAR